MHIHETQVQKRNGAHRGEKKQFTSVREKEKEKKNIKEKKKRKRKHLEWGRCTDAVCHNLVTEIERVAN